MQFGGPPATPSPLFRCGLFLNAAANASLIEAVIWLDTQIV